MSTEKVVTGLRRDAQRNRRLLLDAAGEVLREHGLDASLDEIARRAGVGNATLYRHFPTREKLYEAVFAQTGELLEEVREKVLQIEDPWLALVSYVEEACTFFATDQGLADLMVQGMPDSPTLNEFRIKGDGLLQTLLARAQERGLLRPDVQLTDILFLVCGLQRVIPASAAVCPQAWRRHVTILLDGLRQHPDNTELPSPSLSYDQLFDVVQRFHPAPRGQHTKR